MEEERESMPRAHYTFAIIALTAGAIFIGQLVMVFILYLLGGL